MYIPMKVKNFSVSVAYMHHVLNIGKMDVHGAVFQCTAEINTHHKNTTRRLHVYHIPSSLQDENYLWENIELSYDFRK